MNKIRVMIADDHAMVRQGLKTILELEEDICVVSQASNGEEAVAMSKKIRPDIILMDINMPVINGLQAIKMLKQEPVNYKIIVLTLHQDREYLFKTLQLGCEGYVLKDAESSVLIEAIRSVYHDQTYIQPNMTGELVKEFNRVTLYEQDKSIANNLTNREVEVLKLIAEGMINKEIAKTLYISEKTVKNHISNIFKKLDVNDRTQAAIYAFKHNIKV
ncbi:two component transcriptional regulator, LuxR family [Ruminiclostridium papyrosolvens DSM 2782]|uniref:Stage 0 sporulation protein A homolog n=1 Tax=Ruminiclostridium papyrosolvens DSM 2782 TaxID=588581 RepID=F1TAU0_9FIRM|nr:response regulator transcription factor [Ruminiclostridium papyrosolvens]EGD48633.1 two component transcriptional regulator, LuxR family [Ruminiclostridium papyrosolvens DSM 2782]WES32610.1 response regulator transcription factor [Ruminiclostridium papyrosolvens DSM 2782]